jgi:hypothetical protein
MQKRTRIDLNNGENNWKNNDIYMNCNTERGITSNFYAKIDEI